MTKRFQKILIANRGEIAVRIMRTAKKLGYQTVAVYSEADQYALHVSMADEAVFIGPSPVNQSYLVIDNIIAAAKKSNADAIHPGYGFLSENAAFAEACHANQLIFIGPRSEAIALMGNKRQAKIAAKAAGVPCIPGYEGDDQTDERLLVEAKHIGFPVMIKAAAGGGGRGMRLVHDENHFLAELKSAKSEAKNAFGSDEIILEKAIVQPRHIEIQVIADQFGNTIFLGERDCSIQRRHQKVIEEAPSPFVDTALRNAMGKAAIEAANACNYVNAGTVEFIADTHKNFYFLEMNTRLQVEHPVTECITGIDLVEWQMRIAQGEKLPLPQEKIQLKGHAIEVRLYAEDTTQNFLPQTGTINFLRWPTIEEVRIDTGIAENHGVSPFYDPMIAKIIAYGNDRDQAIERLWLALQNTTLFGVTTNLVFLKNILRHPVFIEGNATTAFIAEHFQDDSSLQAPICDEFTFCVATAVLHALKMQKNNFSHPFANWFNAHPIERPYHLRCGNTAFWIHILATNSENSIVFHCKINDNLMTFALSDIQENSCKLLQNTITKTVTYHQDNQQLILESANTILHFEDITYLPPQAKNTEGDGSIKAPMDGAIIDILVADGDMVSYGQRLITLEAMKIEHPIKANCDGTVQGLFVKPGHQVKKHQLLIEIKPNSSEDSVIN